MKRLISMGVVTGLAAAAFGAAVVLTPHVNSATSQEQQTAAAGGQTPLSVSYAPGTPPEVVVAVEQAIHGLGQRFFVGGPWPQPNGAGTAVSLTYSFPPDGINLPAQFGGDSSGPNTIHATFSAALGPTWQDKFRQVFDAWTAVTGVIYTLVPDDGASWPGSPGSGSRGDLRIVSRNIDGNFGILAFNFFPTTGDMLLDSSDNWGAAGANFRFFRNVAMHEHGHGIGMSHVCPVQQNKLMEPFVSTVFDGPQLDDTRGGQFLYGDPFEPNGTIATATDLAAQGLAFNAPLLINNRGLRNSADVDDYMFTAPSGTLVSVTVTPVGFTYLNGPQNPDSSCTPGTNEDALNKLDPRIRVFDSTGAILTLLNANGLGGVEDLVNFNLGVAGTYIVSVDSVGGGGVSQLYNLVITATNGGLIGDLNNDGCIGAGDLAILLGRWGAAGLGDLNGDGIVGSADLAILLGTWGTGCP